jgi:hypothetical protein
MTDFQIAAASLAILLEVFSDDAEGRSDSVRLNRMRTRVAEGEFWGRLGGLASLEKRLRAGFAMTFKDGHYNDKGELVAVPFPDAIVELFTQLRSCGRSAEQVKVMAKAALPILHGFTAERFSP